jgi:monoamine oxidase
VAPDILILGAGLAGLAAAERLGRAGRPVTMLEARDRIGGRVWTRYRAATSHPIELGAEWIESDGHVRRLLETRGFQVERAQGHHYLRGPDGVRKHDELYPRAILRELEKLGGKDRSVRQALAACSVDPLSMVRYIEGFHAADPDTLSLRWLLEVEKNQSASASPYRSPDGTGRAADVLIARCSGTCTLHLETAIRAVRWKRGGVIVEADTPTGPAIFEARAAIVTLPLPVLAAMRFMPALTSKRSAIEKVAMGHALKVVLVFREEFWRDIAPLGDMLFLHDSTQPFPTWWSMRPAQVPMLTGWAAGPATDRLAGTTLSGLLDLAVDSLAGALGVPRFRVEEELVSGHLHDWRQDPWAMGSYTNVLVGGIDAWKSLARPMAGTLFFAGEATCGKGLNATMEGAVESGWRAAEEALGAILPNAVVRD